jgi:hypothetical protein
MIYLKQGVNGYGLKKILGIKNPVIKKPKRTKDYLHPQLGAFFISNFAYK